jgi:MOSC domain-containing protein YiiM
LNAAGQLVSVNVGTPRFVSYRGKQVATSIFKEPVPGRVAVRGVNVAGDEQADLRVHGGRDKAVYAYSQEDYDWWESELERLLAPGTFGENLTVTGVDPTTAVIGERWHVGSTVLEVSEPRFPCFKLGIKMGSQSFLKRFANAGRPGTYLRIVSEGELGAGDAIDVVDVPDHAITIGRFAQAYLGHRDDLGDLLAADQLSAQWREWITERL